MEWYDGRLEASINDITVFQGDGIVNAANSSLMGGGGVDGAIHRTGGSAILEECRQLRNSILRAGLPVGQAVVTGSGNLPCRYVIHTVGPVWSGGKKGENELLADAYRNSLEKAAETGMKTLAFPSISTGVYGYPHDKAATVVWSVLNDWIPRHPIPDKITLVFFSASNYTAFLDTVSRLEK